MDPASEQPTPTQPSKWKIIGILFGFAVVIFAAIVLVLNYFNIISLSTRYSPLSFLPHETVKQMNIVPTPVNFSSSEFQYDAVKAKKLLTDYIKDTIKPTLFPKEIETKQEIKILQNIQNPSLFSFSFATQSANITVLSHYEKGYDINNSLSISIRLRGIPSTTVDVELANLLLSSYFIDPYVVSDCRQTADSIACENFQTIPEGKKGYGINMFGKPPKSIITIYTCQIPKGSTNYLTAKSCVGF